MHNTDQLIQLCLGGDAPSQKQLYKQYFSFAMTVSMQYCSNKEEAEEIMNDSFYQVFTKLDHYDPLKSFDAWFRRIIINKAIDRYRKNKKLQPTIEIEDYQIESAGSSGYDGSENDLLALIQKLSPAYRTVFNLYVVEGFKHEEIADKLGISISTSKSNLHRARNILKENYKAFSQ
jgi:RNA polymerase sigma factor (sigma-70 family)